MTTLRERLESIDTYPFHMPGHKRNSSLFGNGCFKLDFTETDDTDDLHHPKEILKERMEYAAKIYGSKKTYFLVNGSTCGLLSAVSACTKSGGPLLMARNCHKSVYNAVFLRNLKPVYICPPVTGEGINGGISPDDVEKALQKTNAGAFVMVSPTYEGIVSDVRAISEVCHRHGCILIVDEAHGAHFGFSDEFPESAVSSGADIVIQSLHKTLPSLTQTALLHICSHRADTAEIERYLSIYQSSSPSYILLSSIDDCIEYMAGDKGKKVFSEYIDLLKKFREENKSRIMGREIVGSGNVFDIDISKIIIWGGREVRDSLNRAGLQPEMDSLFYSLALTSIGDTEEGFNRLSWAVSSLSPKKVKPVFITPPAPKIKLTPCEAHLQPGREIPLEESAGRISKAAVYVYPPGIPLINQGEEITESVINLINRYKNRGFDVKGAENKICCL